MSLESKVSHAGRELLSSRLGFILIAAGCAVGLGNVWRFPYVVGQYGGAIFVGIYLICLLLLGVPCVMIELAIGRASKRSIARSFEEIEPKGSFWHIAKYPLMLGPYFLMSFYTVITGWLLYYVYSIGFGDFDHILALSQSSNDPTIVKKAVDEKFIGLLSDPKTMIGYTFVVISLAILICIKGVQKGVEKFSKPLMVSLLLLLIGLAIYCVSLDGAGEGLKYYLMPNLENAQKVGFIRVIYEALNQAFFTLSVGIGCLLIFGSYIDKRKSLYGESLIIALIDSFVALMAGFIIFPACFSYGVNPAAGPTLLFQSMLTVFAAMEYGRIFGTLFFIFMFFAAFTTVLTVIENAIAITIEQFKVSRIKASIINYAIIFVISIPCALGFNEWSGFEPLGKGTNLLDLEDFILSNNMLPFGSLYLVVFSVLGWRYKNLVAEVNEGEGLKLSSKFKYYFIFILPIIISIILVFGYIERFS